MAKLIKVIVINSELRTITEMEIKPDYRVVSGLVGGSIEGAIDPRIDRKDTLYCDAMGWMKPVKGVFRLGQIESAGTAVLLGTTSAGNWVSCKTTIEQVRKYLLWR